MATEQIPTTLIADDAVTNAKIGADAVSTTEIANDASISTSGNITTTGSGTLTVAGASTFSGGIANSGTITAGTIGDNVNLPKGISQGVNYLQQVQSSGTSVGGTLGGTGVRACPFNTIRAGTEDGAFTQDILSLSSNLWTMRTGYYIWDFWRQNYYSNHVWLLGISTYGDNTGSGTDHGNVTTDNVNFGTTFWYVHASAAHAIPTMNTGVLKVTHTAQKYTFRINIEADNQHSTSTYTHSSSFHNIQQSLRFIRIGDV